MKINQVEQLVGITKGNIRFYEKEGLLTPGRNHENGYRDYSDADVAWLKKIKLLRMLDVPIEEIRLLKAGTLTLEDAMGRHIIQLERRQANLAAAQGVCAHIRDSGRQLDGLDAVSIGPDLVDIHSTREKMSISSVRRTWAYLCAVLREL